MRMFDPCETQKRNGARDWSPHYPMTEAEYLESHARNCLLGSMSPALVISLSHIHSLQSKAPAPVGLRQGK